MEKVGVEVGFEALWTRWERQFQLWGEARIKGAKALRRVREESGAGGGGPKGTSRDMMGDEVRENGQPGP